MFVLLGYVREVQSGLQMSLVADLVLEALHLAPALVYTLWLRERRRWQGHCRPCRECIERAFSIAYIEIWIWLRDQLGRNRIVVLRCVTRGVLHSFCRPKFIRVEAAAHVLPDLWGRPRGLWLSLVSWRGCCLNNLNVSRICTLREILLIGDVCHPLFDLNY